MRPIVTEGVVWSVCLSVTATSCAKTVEPIEMPFGVLSEVSPGNHVLGLGAHWRLLVNTIEPTMCGGDAVVCQIILTTCCPLQLQMMDIFVDV